MDKKRHPLAKEIPRHISSGNQDLARLSKPQQEVAVMRLSSPDARLNSALAGMVAGMLATKDGQDVSAQPMLFCTTYIN